MQHALVALRGALSDIESEVDAQLRQGGEEGLTDGTLRRWLVARKMQVNVAAAHIKAHAAWRATWAPAGRVLESEITTDLAHKKIFLQGTDRQGRPVLLLQARKHVLTESTAQQRYMCYVLDTGISIADTTINPDSKLVGIFDLEGLAYKNLDAVGLKNVFHLLQSHYVERLSKLYMFNAPSIFWAVWKMVKPFIDPVTREKVVFLSTSDLQVLHQEVGVELLPSYLGGTAKLIDIQEAAAQLSGLQHISKQAAHLLDQQQLAGEGEAQGGTAGCPPYLPQVMVAAS